MKSGTIQIKKMTREQYIQHRNNNHLGNVVYHYYQTACVEQELQPLPPEQFLRFFNIWEHAKEAMDLVLSYYDEQLEIYGLSHKGKVIKYF